ncbi:glycosyltransferase family 2 protein [Dankookia sp. GCM10030260]|uniref:glycosyltransferase family 2 protein n=1 Tax=Dankookia sp. GCM10030260 TaxID=3273390 RepID=UPI0036125573
MPNLPSACIIVPMRDVAPFLHNALASIGADPRLEILLVDDGSRDGTAELAAGLARQDRRIQLLPGQGRGPSAARNLAIGAARAPLVAFLDADDCWRPGKLDRQLALHRRHPQLGFSFTDYRHVTPEGEDRGSCFGYWPHFAARHAPTAGGPAFELGADALAQIYAENVVGTSTVVARTDLLRQVGGFGTAWGSAEDWDLWLRLAALAPVGCVPAMLTDYLMHRPGAVSRNAGKRARAIAAIAAEHRAAAARLNPALARAGEAGLLVAAAEAAGRRRAALLLRLRALAIAPSRRVVREAIRGVFSGPAGAPA